MALGQETLTHSRRPRLQNSSSGHAKPLIATRVARFLPVLDKSDARQRLGQFVRIGHVARINVMAQTNAVFAVQQIAQAYLSQIMAALLVMSPLRQMVALIGAGHVGIEVRRVVGQYAAADQLLLFPKAEESDLCLLQLFLRNAVETVPELLRSKTLRRKAPLGTQDGAVIPISDFGFRSGLADTVEGGQQQIMRRRGAGARGGPQRLEQLKNAGALGCQPEGAGQAEVQSGGFQRKGSGSVSDERGHLFGATEISLANIARLAVDACAFDDVVVEMIAFLLGDERCHIG